MKDWNPDDGNLRCITVTTIVRFEYSGDGLKAAETEIVTSVDQSSDDNYSDVILEVLPSHLQYHIEQRRMINA